MRFGLGLVLGLVIGGLGGGGIGYLAATSGVTILRKADKQEAHLTESYFLCKTTASDRDYPLIIKSSANKAQQIIYPGKTDADVFLVKEISDLHYIAIRPNDEAPEAFSTMDLNRVTGQLVIQGRFTREVIDLLVGVCNKEIPANECASRIAKMKGGASWVDCMGTANDLYCPRYKGSGLPMPMTAQCRKTDTHY